MAFQNYSLHLLQFLLTKIVCLCGVNSYNTKFTEYEKLPVNNSRVLAADIIIVQGSTPSLVLCLAECSKDENCISVNYNALTTTCELNKHKLDFVGVYLAINVENWYVYEKNPCALAMKSGDYCHYMLFIGDNWYGARNFCLNMGLDLVKIETASEQAAFNVSINMAYIGIHGYAWIGGFKQDDQWFWADGNPMTFQTPSGGGDCALAHIIPGTPWLSVSCLDGFVIVCERRD